MDNPIIIILSVFFVDHVIFFLCIVDTKQTPRPFAQNQVFLFLKKEKKISFTRISPEFYQCQKCIRFFSSPFFLCKKILKKISPFFVFPLTLYSVLPATYLLFLNKLQSTYYVLYGIVQYTSVKKTYFFPVTFFSSQF